MPWDIVRHNGQFCLRKQGTTEIVKGSCHSDRAMTVAMQRALYASESKSTEDDMENNNSDSVIRGGAIKALGAGKIGGYLVLFTSADSPDLQGEFFTKSTDFFIENGDKRPIFYRHGAHPVIKSRRLGNATLTLDDVGVFLEGELNLRDNYEKGIYKLAEQGKLGWSSGSMGHLVTKKPNGKSLEILTWPIGEASLTPNPVEGRTVAVPLKSLMDEDEPLDGFLKELEQEEEYNQQFSLDGIPSIKAFCEAVAPMSLKNGSHRSISAADAAKEFITIARILGEAYDSYMSRLVKRTEHRFLKEGREIDSSTVAQVEKAISDIEQILPAIIAIKDSLLGIRKLSEMTKAEAKAMEEQARFALWNYYRISGYKPQELEDNA